MSPQERRGEVVDIRIPPGELSVFGCAFLPCFSGNGDGTKMTFSPVTVGGGIEYCTIPDPEHSCTEDDANGDPDVGVSFGRFGIGLEIMDDGTYCMSLGPQIGLPGPVIGTLEF
ncbi:MAG: hypothetical protein AAF542_25340 [Pseudomonadota bacterium]